MRCSGGILVHAGTVWRICLLVTISDFPVLPAREREHGSARQAQRQGDQGGETPGRGVQDERRPRPLSRRADQKAKWFRFDSRFAGKQLTLSVGRYGEKKSDTTLATFMTAIRDVGTDAVDAALGRSHRRNARLKYRINDGGVTPALAASIGEEALELAKLLARGLSMTR